MREHASAIERALADASRPLLEMACRAFAEDVARHAGVPVPVVKVLASRPRRVYRDGTVELFGDYDLEAGTIRVWMKTAVQKKVTSFGTFFSTLCHELCHHLDVTGLGLPETHHTRGFYERTAALYHHARGTPRRPLAWIPLPKGRYRVDWASLRRAAPPRGPGRR